VPRILPETIRAALAVVADGYGLPTAAARVGVSREGLRDALDAPAYADAYTRAREQRADAVVDRMDRVARQVLTGAIKPDQGRVVLEHQRWLAARLRPAHYGDRLEHRLTADGGLAAVLAELGRVARARALPARPEPIDVTPTPPEQYIYKSIDRVMPTEAEPSDT